MPNFLLLVYGWIEGDFSCASVVLYVSPAWVHRSIIIYAINRRSSSKKVATNDV